MTATTARTAPSGMGLQPAAEVALMAVSVATVAGMWRLFVDGSYFVPLAAHALAAHVLAAACRRRGVPTAASAAITGVAAVLALTWAHLGDTTALGLPTGETLSAASGRLDEAWQLFDEVRAPAPVLPGFLLTAGAAMWVGAWLADFAAFRLWTALEALIPSGTVFVFASLFAAERARTGAAAVWLATALAFCLLHRTARQHGSPSWLGSDPRLGTASLLKVGAALVAVAVAVGWLLGPRLPGADDRPVVAVRDLDGESGSRQTISPLVEIRGRLVEQSDVDLFSVRASQRAYWRLTSLDEFDGDVWSSRGSFGNADGDLDDVAGAPPGAIPVTQQISVTGLAAIWLPAAFEPRSIDPGEADVRWEADSSTLIVSNDFRTSDGLSYEVVSAVPTGLTAELLSGVGDAPPDIAERGTRLPPGFPTTVTQEAQRIVAEAGATTPYAVALALQDSFRDGSFAYTLDVAPGHSDSAIEEFLFVRRTGYCEQFAGTYAAMARAVGLPARVAVGFTPGEPMPTDPTLFQVRGEHAHAWPEVWIPGTGWVAFEPTPGRGAPNAGYTGVEESQDTSGPSTEPTTVPTTQVPSVDPTALGAAPTTAPPITDVGQPDPLTPTERRSSPIGRWLWWGFLAVVGLAVLLGLAALGIAAWRAVRRWRRRASATTPDAKVRSAWTDVVEAVGVVGLVPRRHETPVEFAHRAARELGDSRATPLAWVLEQADYAAEAVGDDAATRAEELAAGLRRAVHERTTTRARLLAAVDPRPADRRGRRRGPRPAGPRIQIRGESR
jgi:transglutaminase-like putative cysteine protease